MTTRYTSASLLIASLTMLAACGRSDAEQDVASGAGTPAAVGPATSDAGTAGIGPRTTMRVVVTGGPKAGTWTKSQVSPTCTMGYAGEDVFGVAANELDQGGDGLLGVDITVPDARNGVSGSTGFRLIAYIGGSDAANQLEIYPKDEKGSGTATVVRSGTTATVTVRGRTADGNQVDAQVECGTVLGG